MRDAWARLEELARDRESGATEIARGAVDALEGLEEERIVEGVRVLLQGHPSMAPLWRFGSEVLAAAAVRDAAGAFTALLEAEPRASEVLRPIVSGVEVLTLSYSSSVVELVRLARPATVRCMRSEPGGEGARMAEAIAAWTIASVIEDEAVLDAVPAKLVIVGTDAVTPTAVINKMKTHALAAASRGREIPVYAIAGETKFLGSELPIAPAFERAPLELFTAIATPSGLLDPEEAARHARARPVHPALRPLLDELITGER